MGKAQDVYSLDAEQSADYRVIKKLVLPSYALVPEGYCQHFQTFKMESRRISFGVCAAEGNYI